MHAPLAIAQTSFSTSFQSADSMQETFGGNGTSSSFSSVQNGGQTVTGEATSTNFVLKMGFLYFDAWAPRTQNWRWYDDSYNETPVMPLANENTAPINIDSSNPLKLRIAVAETAGVGMDNVKFRLQYGTTSDFSSGGYAVSEIGNCNGASVWCYALGGGVDNAVVNDVLLTDSDSCVAGVGAGCGTHNESGVQALGYLHQPSAVAEYEFTIEASGALTNTTYFFRLLDLGASTTVAYNTGESFPSVVTGGTSLTFTIDGLELGTSTDGVTTDIETTSTEVPFGTLLANTSVDAAHRFTVSTNASGGYKIFVAQRQGFLANNGGEIPPVTATNETPASWGSGCGSDIGCFGYHTGEDILDGGSTRFAANDTYAQFTSTPKEIAYASTPVANRQTDIVYRVEARALQDAGEYSTNLVYIVTPVF